MITCLHTADVHVATFGALLPDASHVVRVDFLDRARADGVDAVADEVKMLLGDLASQGPVLCTCSTLGPLVDEVALSNVVRIDRPAMEAAVSEGGEVVVAICLESTRDATMALFDEVSAGRASGKLVLCDAAWPFFEAGDMAGFAQAIVDAVSGQASRVLLAQASMAVAAPLFAEQGVEVFTTPKAAADAVAALA
ncbi:hypothetical protein SAMN05444287_1406 [Octadecabacter temperatus]|uniref:Uncharacterized protein n=1 Tax=Octadecabacter temperatus TaxID=1458307 RepID=A0A0K0Y5R5_9RHOB|nr:hypothetical protein [Octadecabacter temperatus]AKS46294.1 hypothetical protein OSB_17490 [Octadecabacter temperatus]SIO11416.1 hypothetical protein SAMN05444287_1406 [Octadecabacter temperatus]